jgi:hypothetical protein
MNAVAEVGVTINLKKSFEFYLKGIKRGISSCFNPPHKSSYFVTIYFINARGCSFEFIDSKKMPPVNETILQKRCSR